MQSSRRGWQGVVLAWKVEGVLSPGGQEGSANEGAKIRGCAQVRCGGATAELFSGVLTSTGSEAG